MSYMNLPTEALDFAKMLATTPGGGGAPTFTPDSTAAAPSVPEPPPYEPPPLNLMDAHDNWLTRAMQIIGAAGSKLDPSAFRRAKDRQTANTLSALFGGIGAAGNLRSQDATDEAKRINQERTAQYQAREEAKRQVYVAGGAAGAAAKAREPFDIAAENRGVNNQQRMSLLDLWKAVEQHKQEGQYDISTIGDRIQADTLARIKNQLATATKYGLMSPADAAQFDMNKQMFDLKSTADRYQQLVPSDVAQQLNYMRQMESDLRRNIMSIPAQSRDKEMMAQVEQMKLAADGFHRQAEVLRSNALSAGLAQLQNIPEEDRGPMELYLRGMFSDEGRTEAETADAASSIVADDTAWSQAGQDDRMQALRNEFAKAMSSEDLGTVAGYWQNINKRMATGFGRNKEMLGLMDALTKKVMAWKSRPSAKTPTPAFSLDAPAAAPADSARVLTPGLMDDSEPGAGEDSYSGYERRNRKRKKETP